jgi:hypothetical protein
MKGKHMSEYGRNNKHEENPICGDNEDEGRRNICLSEKDMKALKRGLLMY